MLAAPPGSDVLCGEDRMESARAFANKIWNAARFLFLNMERAGVEPWAPDEASSYRPEAVDGAVPLEDRWMFSRLSRCAGQVNRSLESCRFHEAAQTLWHFLWHEFCDWYLEIKKLRFVENSGLNAHWRNILTVFETSLRLLHPVMPFLTEELWQRLAKGRPGRPLSIALSRFPSAGEIDEEAETEMGSIQEIIAAARAMRADGKLDPKLTLDAVLYADGKVSPAARAQREAIEKLAGLRLELAEAGAVRGQGSLRSTPDFDLLVKVPAAQLAAQRTRLEKEIQNLEKVIANSKRQLENQDFLAKAPANVLEILRAKLADYEAQLAKSRAALEGLGG
jgi:valyl-tRNA synthetase